jgi:hypothetical protein
MFALGLALFLLAQLVAFLVSNTKLERSAYYLLPTAGALLGGMFLMALSVIALAWKYLP